MKNKLALFGGKPVVKNHNNLRLQWPIIDKNDREAVINAFDYTCYADGIALAGFTIDNLSVGSHNIYCEVDDGSNIVSSDSIQVTVLDAPHISVPESITVTAEVGDNSATGDFVINNSGYGNMNWNISTSSSMLSFSQNSGVDDATVALIVDTSALDAGDYYGDVVITSSDADNSSQTISVLIHVIYITNNTASRDFENSNSQYVYKTDSSQTNLDLGINGTNFTIETWIKLESLVAAHSQGTMQLFSKRSDPDKRGITWFMENVNGKDYFIIGLADNPFSAEIQKSLNIGYALGTNIWYHIAAVYRASVGSVEFFINGTSIGIVSGLPNSVANNSANLELLYDSHNETKFDGKADDYRLWKVARTATEIFENYSQELIGNEPGLVANWKFNNDVLDITSNNNHLMNNGSAVYSTDTATAH